MSDKERNSAIVAIGSGFLFPIIIANIFHNSFVIVFAMIVGFASILGGLIKLISGSIRNGNARKRQAVKYVGCLSTHTFHRPSCRSVKMLTRENRVDYGSEITCQQLKNIGMKPCSKCKPR